MTEKEPKSFALTLVVLISITAFIAVLIYSELDRKSIKDAQNKYQSDINTIQLQLDQGNCSEAAVGYTRAKKTRDEIIETGLYYSLESHAKQAHAIEIAECFAAQEEFQEAINIIEMEEVHDPDYLSRAAVIYEKAGDVLKAEETKAMADKFDTTK